MTLHYVNDAASDNTGDGLSPANAKKWLWLDIGANDSMLKDVTNAPAAGDIVYVLENHDEDIGYGTNTITNNSSVNAPINVITVDDLTTPTRYGTKSNSRIWQGGVASGGTININPGLYFQGFEIYASEYIAFGAIATDLINKFTDGKLRQGYSGRHLRLYNKRSKNYLINTDLEINNGEITITQYGSSMIWNGGSLISDCSGFDDGDRSGKALIQGVDISAMAGNMFSSAFNGEHSAQWYFHRCKIPASITYAPTLRTGQFVKYHSCDSGDGYYWFGEFFHNGSVVFDTSNARSATYDGTNKFSALVTTNTSNSGDLSKFLEYKLVSIPGIDLTTAKTLTIELSQYNVGGAPTALTDHEFWVGVQSPNSTDLALGDWSYSNADTGLFDTASDLTTSTETWTQTSNITKQKAIVELDAVAGATNALLTVYIYVSKVSAVINVCSLVDITDT